MSEKKKTSLLPKVEILIIIVFFLSFLVWAATRCNTTKERYQEEAAVEAATQEAAPPAVDTVRAPEPVRPVRERYTALYITIDGTNLRAEPTLNSEILDQLKLFEEVAFLNEVSDFTEEVNLGKETANEPWVKVKSPKGKVGWVYGACVHYYRYKHPGAE